MNHGAHKIHFVFWKTPGNEILCKHSWSRRGVPSAQEFPSSLCGVLVPSSPPGKQSRGRGKAPGGWCFSFLQLLWIYPEFSVDEGSSAIWQLQQNRKAGHHCGLFSSGKGMGRKLGALKLLNRWIGLLMKFIIDGGFVHWHCFPFGFISSWL